MFVLSGETFIYNMGFEIQQLDLNDFEFFYKACFDRPNATKNHHELYCNQNLTQPYQQMNILFAAYITT